MKKFMMMVVVMMLFSNSIYADEYPDIVDEKKIYEGGNIYADTEEAIHKIHERYPGLTNVSVVGQSVEGRNLTAIKLGTGKTEIFICASYHAREYMTTVLTLNQIEYICQAYEGKQQIDGYDVTQLLDKVSIWFVPLVNPDGVELCTRGLDSVNDKQRILNIVKSNFDFTTWKANINGVDLNRNHATGRPDWSAVKSPASENYAGPYDHSEPETQAMVQLCSDHQFESLVSYHAAGEIIYWYFGQSRENEARDYGITKQLLNITGYKEVKKNLKVTGKGFRDWFVQTYEKPGFTIEIMPGAITKPRSFNYYENVWNQNRLVPIYLMNEAAERVGASAFDVPVIWENGRLTALGNQSNLVDEKIQVPLRKIVEYFQGEVLWNEENHQIEIKCNEKTAHIIPDERKIVMEGKPSEEDPLIEIKDGLTYIGLDRLKGMLPVDTDYWSVNRVNLY